MRKPFIVRPTGLKGSEKVDRMKDLMGIKPLNEDVKNSVVELTKLGPDGKVYGIVREGHNYFIKVTDKQSNIVTEDFNYIGGLMNKTSEVYPSYAKAIKQLNLKFMSLNEAYGKKGNFNVFEDDNLLTEHHPYKADQALSATKGMGDGAEYIVDKAGVELSYDSKEGKEDSQFGDNLADKDVMDEFESVKLSESEMAIEEMLVGEAEGDKEVADDKVAKEIKNILSQEELEFLQNAYVSDREMVSKAIDAELNEGIYEGTPEPPAEGEFGMSKDEIKLRQIIDKLITKGAIASLVGVIPAMAGAPFLALGLGIAALAGSPLKDAAWWSRKGHNYSAQNKYGVKETRKGFSITSALEKMDSIIGEDANDKVTEILNSLTESEKDALLSTLKKSLTETYQKPKSTGLFEDEGVVDELKRTPEFRKLGQILNKNPELKAEFAEIVKDEIKNLSEGEKEDKSESIKRIINKLKKIAIGVDLGAVASTLVTAPLTNYDMASSLGIVLAGLGLGGAIGGIAAHLGVGDKINSYIDSRYKNEGDLSEAEEIKGRFEKEYGKEGESIYYATANAQGRDPETFEKLEEEVKYKLKVAAPSTPSLPVSEPEVGDTEDINIDLDAPEDKKDDKPFDDTPFDAGVEANEDEDPEKYIQQLAGKLGTTLRKYTEDKGEPDFDLEKFAINSVISATHTAEMDDEDQKDIIKKIKSSGDDEKDVNVDVNVDTGDGGDEDKEEPKSDEVDVNVDGEEQLDEVGDSLFQPDPAKSKFESDARFAKGAETLTWESEDLLSDAVVAFGTDAEGFMEENHEELGELKHNMFFNDVFSIFQSVTELLEMDDNTVDALLSEGHGWALDHIATANNQLESVYHFLEGSEAAITEGGESNNYMFFQNLKNLRHASHEILNMDVYAIDEMLSYHEWMLNLTARANDDVEEVYHFLMGALDGYDEEEYAEWSEPMELVSNVTLNETLDYEDKLAEILASNPNNLKKAEKFIGDLNVDTIKEYQSDFQERGLGGSATMDDINAEDTYNKLLKNRAIKQIILGASAIGLSFAPLMMAAREVALSMNLKIGEGADWFTVLTPLVLVNVLVHTLFRIVDKAKTKAKDEWISNWKNEKYGNKSEANEYGDITISEELKYHLDNKIALGESVFRYGSEKFIKLVNEVKSLYSKGLIKLNENDEFIVKDLTNEYVKIGDDKLKMDFIFEADVAEYPKDVMDEKKIDNFLF